MTVRKASILVLSFLLALGTGGAEADPWAEHALSDDEAARMGREVLPFTRAQIVALGRLFDETRAATMDGAGERPEARHSRLRLEPGSATALPEVLLARGYTTALSFTDMTGEPWPIEEVLVDSRFVPDDGGERAEGARHILYLSPVHRHLHGNAVVKLQELDEPVVLALVAGTGTVDFHVDLRIADAGPNADPSALVAPRTFHAGDPVLLDLLAGIQPEGATRLRLTGAAAGDRAWADDGDILLVTRALVLSPGPWAAERSADGRWAWRMPQTPYALVSMEGREARVAIEEEAGYE